MSTLVDLVWLIPVFPLAGALVLLVLGRSLGEPRAGWLATAAMVGSFVATVLVFVGLLGYDSGQRQQVLTLFEWVPVGNLAVDIGFLVDPLSITMALFVTGVGALIHLYSIGYMHGDVGFSRFFIYLNFFAFSMLMLVLGDNLLLTFLGWEGVGACSYLLISFWFTEEANASAGKKAFVTNRVGDWGFLVAMFLAFLTFGSLQYGEMFFEIESNGVAASTASGIALLLLVGAAGKSAQFPLHVWLPDAMAGPTPVSALIHAATMVTAGVYLLIRMNPILVAAHGWVPDLIMWVGLGTALMAATIAVAQNDIKKVLAYSTISQLGFMFVAVGSGAYVAAIFHMVTHAFFKALLFLGAGSVIHGMDGDQDLRHYGGLAKALPITSLTFVVGWLAIAGVPPFSGFWSKDEILAYAYAENTLLWLLLLATAVLTAFYMTRLVLMTFYGSPRWTSNAVSSAASELDSVDVVAVEPAAALPQRHPHESPWTMWLPLVLLAGLAAVAGALNLPFSSDVHFLEKWLDPALYGHAAHVPFGGGTKWVLGLIAIIGSVAGVAGGAAVYACNRIAKERIERPFLARAWGIDELLSNFMGGPGRAAFARAAQFDQQVVDGAVNATGMVVRRVGTLLRSFQNGLVRSYALFIAMGALALMVWFLTRAGM
ncbi:MAG: NADH-quinone oxidoreductase subunit L [Acidimicrobiia bacterium]|nr:NADH-quinone oxidoreductase subunit L [Acidimicrobiia bacterium]MYC57707.1 NADH-quinone oxidoreductase subunit L [Acidimicrobiia bacterium]MYG93611.1 NADH-quinone oxidoreductase subunit L [Acidimicrobiia bacterium]MYI30906.1 NADH-quinone oxidoreductase subunit L [Acidimicrobiia bacterium]